MLIPVNWEGPQYRFATKKTMFGNISFFISFSTQNCGGFNVFSMILRGG